MSKTKYVKKNGKVSRKILKTDDEFLKEHNYFKHSGFFFGTIEQVVEKFPSKPYRRLKQQDGENYLWEIF